MMPVMLTKEKGPPKMRAVQFEPGDAANMRLERVLQPGLKDEEVLIKVYAAGINRADVIQRQGHYPPPEDASDILGLEVCGVVDKVSESSSKWQEGDYVMALLSGGGYSEYVTVHEDLVMRVPNDLSFEEGASIPENWITAYQLLHFIAKVKEDDIVLIHAGGSGVGLAAIQLVKVAGAIPIVTAGADKKLIKAREVGARVTINYKTEDFVQRVLDETDGKGANIILDCVGQLYVEKNLQAIAQDGRWILYGLLSGGEINGNFLGPLLKKRIMLQGTTLRSRSLEYRSNLVDEFTSNILPLFDDGTLKPIIDSWFPFGKVVDAHHRMEQNENIGKIVLLVRGDAIDYD